MTGDADTRIVIRPAAREDVPAVLVMIAELAAYEQLAHEAVGTEAALLRDLFGARPVAEVVIGEVAGETAGFALFFTSYSTFLTQPGLYLEDLFVRPSFRGVGLGKALLKHLAGLAVERDYGRFEWSVLDWNTPAIDFYRAAGASPKAGWTVYRLAEASLAEFAAPGAP